MAKNNFIVPASERKDFRLLVQRANRTIQANLKMIENEKVETERTKRALLGDYVNKSAWSSQKTVFSRSIKFETERDYKAYIRHLQRWGGSDSERSVSGTRGRIYKNIIKALNTTADIYGQGVKDESGYLPKEITDRLKKMSTEQLMNFFDIADPSEDIEYQSWSYEEFQEGVDRETFVDITVGRLNYLEQVVKDKRVKGIKKPITKNKVHIKKKKR